jgi:hypothetical protein
LNQLRDAKNGKFDAILFSGGGNDLVGDAFRLWLNDGTPNSDPANALNRETLDDIVGVVRGSYKDLIATRNLVSPAIPIFVHGYDFALPTDIGVCGIGPWLYPSLHSRGWMGSIADLTVGAEIVKLMLLKFRELLLDLSKDKMDNVIFVETQGTLSAREWANELHPNPAGFTKIAEKFSQSLANRFDGRPVIAATSG